jgi:pyruvate-ferredoxin/flavodoxin oxidoreductase
MWNRKKPGPPESPAHPGLPQLADGHAILADVAVRTGTGVFIRAVPLFAGLTESLRRYAAQGARPVQIREARALQELAALAAGATLTGLRSTIITDSLAGLTEELYAMAGQRLGCVINLTARAMARHAGSLHGGHDEYHAAAGAGCFQLFAGTAQEVADFNLIARRVAELALTPGLCAQDLYGCSHALQKVLAPDDSLIDAYLGQADDLIVNPTPSQALLFGRQRRRLPLFLDRDHPAGFGATQDRESYFRALAAQRPFFYAHLPDLIGQALSEFAALTGRSYAAVTGYRTDDAEVLVIAQGAITEELHTAADTLRERDGIRAGIIQLCQLRPFPGAQLIPLLRGRKAVTILERTDQPLAEDLPLAREIRAALDKSMENGRTRGSPPPYPGYPVLARPGDRPEIFTGIYGIGSDLPEESELRAVVHNMLRGAGAKRCFYVGRMFTPPERRFPHLQTLHQQLLRDYPALEQLAVSGAGIQPMTGGGGSSAAIHFLSSQRGIFAVNTFAQALAETGPWQVRTWPRGGVESNLQPASITLLYGRADAVMRAGKPGIHDLIGATSHTMIENPLLLASIKPGGTLVVACNSAPETLRHALPRRVQLALRENAIRVLVINARRIAAETASNPALIDHLIVWALLGVYLKQLPDLDKDGIAAVHERLAQKLHDIFGTRHPRRGEITQTMARAAGEVIELPGEFWQHAPATEQPEPASPWTVRAATADREQVFDATRFWHSVGFFYDSGQAEQTLSDPFLATGIMPAASSAFRDLAPYRLRLPEWRPENCTGCGICWSACPESALPPVVLDPATIIRGGIAQCEARGGKFIQLPRLLDPLARQAYRLLAGDELGQYLRMGSLLQTAWTRATEALQLNADKRGQLEAEFRQLNTLLEDFPLARTENFFAVPHQRVKNSGMTLSITLNPMTCTGCGVCIAACPDRALAWVGQTPERNALLAHNWQVQLALPDPTPEQIASLLAAEQPETQVNLLLSRRAYLAMLGGDGTRPGNGPRTALHLVIAAAAAVMQQRYDRHTGKLRQMIADLEAAVRGDVSRTMNINDFDDFSRRLTRLEGKPVSVEGLAELIGEQSGNTALDSDKLRRQGELVLRLKQQLADYQHGATGNGRARMMLVMDPGINAGDAITYPYNAHTQPWICYPSAHAAGLAEGLLHGISQNLQIEINQCRAAELELSGADYRQHPGRMAGAADGRDYSAAEQALLPPVFVVCHCGADLRPELNRLQPGGRPVKLILINKFGLTVADNADQPHVAGADAGNSCYPEMLALAQSGVLVIQASIGHPGDLIRGVVAAVNHPGPALLHVYAPDPLISGIPQEQIFEQALLAYRSRTFPLFRMQREGALLKVMLDANPAPAQDWLFRDVKTREANGQESVLTAPLTMTDWAMRESRFHGHFTVQPLGQVHENMRPLTEFLALDPGARADLQPYVEFVNDKQQHFIALLSPALASANAAVRAGWRTLQAMAARPGAATAEPAAMAKTAAAPVIPESAATILSAHADLSERLLELCGYRQDPEFFRQSLREFLQQDPGRASAPAGTTTAEP